MPGKRKRPSGVGQIVDESTGEVIVVQTTRAAKQAHKRNGAKWYKEPTEAELRAWDRDDKRKAAVAEHERREEVRERNKRKREQKHEKDNQIQQDLFEKGKITYTQTLAKKEEDQNNLHKWFGGRPQSPCPRKRQKVSHAEDDGLETSIICDQEEVGLAGMASVKGADRLSPQPQMKSKSAPVETSRRPNVTTDVTNNDTHITVSQYELFLQSTMPSSTKYGSNPLKDTPSTTDPTKRKSLSGSTKDSKGTQEGEMQHNHSMMSNAGHGVVQDARDEFEIYDDKDDPQRADQQGDPTASPVFKVPALPNKIASISLPLSPLSRRAVENRDNILHTTELNHNKNQASYLCVQSKTSVSPAHNQSPLLTQRSVKNLLSGLSTQDLSFDDETTDDEDIEDKENNEFPSPSRKPILPSKADSIKRSDESFDGSVFNEVFADIYPDDLLLSADTKHTSGSADIDYSSTQEFDDDLDDSTLLAIPATQWYQKAYDWPTPEEDDSINDSFTVPGLDDDALLEEIEQFERTASNSTTDSSRLNAEQVRLATSKPKRRTLPWCDRMMLKASSTQKAREEYGISSQDTELWRSQESV